MAKLTIAQLALAGRRVFVRADLNAPLDHGAVSDDTRLRAVVPTIQHALKAGASVVLASHLGRPKGKVAAEFSLRPIADRLNSLLGQPRFRTEGRTSACEWSGGEAVGADGAYPPVVVKRVDDTRPTNAARLA